MGFCLTIRYSFQSHALSSFYRPSLFFDKPKSRIVVDISNFIKNAYFATLVLKANSCGFTPTLSKLELWKQVKDRETAWHSAAGWLCFTGGKAFKGTGWEGEAAEAPKRWIFGASDSKTGARWRTFCERALHPIWMVVEAGIVHIHAALRLGPPAPT